MPFIKRLQEIRIHKAFSRDELASRAGLPITSINKLEGGEQIPCCQTLEALAGALEVPLYELFYDGEREPRTPWLSPRPSLEDLQARSFDIKPETGLIERVKVLRRELSALLH